MEYRADAAMTDPSFYNVGNWLSMGTFDTVKGTFTPDDPLSFQHWMDSMGTATIIFGGYKIVTSPRH